MTLPIPKNAREIFDRMSTDAKTATGELDPYLSNALIKAIVSGDANAFFELYKTLQQVSKNSFWDTATGEFLLRWAAIFGITQLAATISTGFVVFTGVNQSSIPSGTQFTSSAGNIYETTMEATVSNTIVSITSINRISDTATVLTAINHGLASNIEIVIAGAVETDYNGTVVITVTGLNTLTYTVSGAPSTPATGTITLNAIYATVSSQSQNTGADQNLPSGSSINLSSTIPGVDSEGFVAFDELGGGTDEESIDSTKDRLLFRTQNPITAFNKNNIILQSKTVSGVTRVFVQNSDDLLKTITASAVTRDGTYATFDAGASHSLQDGMIVSISGANQSEYNVFEKRIIIVDSNKFGYVVPGTPTTPATGTIIANVPVSSLGQVFIYFVRDNDDSIIPTAGEVEDVKQALQAIRPFTLSNADMIVKAPIGVTVPFTFSELTPNTTAMQTAITNNLTSFFSTGTSLAVDVKQIDYASIINSTLDSGGNPVVSFNLSTPTTDIAIDIDEIALIGTIAYP